ncbi:dihydrofolate reductase family protein [Pseudonocardia sp. HH130630-07]|uniref:dihydrofolate reductase family protein n=1 Tax=Pseudonocardia sp. HH130630-07 TaxID=1690815 RepID=UPI000815053B|nr:dihydrofolate reductase family protein [Pseudonocardia sp. HH130630-07]ANY06062.1 deaminase [Pseudonocardia sp. HH130630-07]
MGRLRYTVIMSLDGYLTDADGRYDWAMPDDEVVAHVTARESSADTHLYGRRMYTEMRGWEDVTDGRPGPDLDFARGWRAADKIVYSTSLPGVTTARTRLERTFDPVAVRALVDALPGDASISGPTLAAEALRQGIVDDIELYVVPVLVGGGLRALPYGARYGLEPVEQHRFGNGFVLLHYRRTG